MLPFQIISFSFYFCSFLQRVCDVVDYVLCLVFICRLGDVEVRAVVSHAQCLLFDFSAGVRWWSDYACVCELPEMETNIFPNL